MSRSIEGAKPSIVRVKRRRQDPAPLDLSECCRLSDFWQLGQCSHRHVNLLVAVIEAPRQAAHNADPADCFATLAVSTNHTHKRRKFQLVTTISDKHQETEDLLQALQSGSEAASALLVLAASDHAVNSATVQAGSRQA